MKGVTVPAGCRHELQHGGPEYSEFATAWYFHTYMNVPSLFGFEPSSGIQASTSKAMAWSGVDAVSPPDALLEEFQRQEPLNWASGRWYDVRGSLKLPKVPSVERRVTGVGQRGAMVRVYRSLFHLFDLFDV